MKKTLIALLAALTITLGSCDDDSPRKPPTLPNVVGWEIGPIISGRNYSVNMPITANADNSFPIGPDKEPHYVTRSTGSIVDKTQIRMRFRIEGPEGAKLMKNNCPGHISLYFQHRNDTWGKDGMRWWATFATINNLEVGEYTLVAPLNGKWTSVMTMTAETDPGYFYTAKQNAGRVGFTFGDCTGYGHGTRATDEVKFKILEYVVE